MDPTQAALFLGGAPGDSLAFSALPDAPVVPPRERRPYAVGVRVALAHGLERLARAVEPRPTCAALRS
jgi:hypothetical protein